MQLFHPIYSQKTDSSLGFLKVQIVKTIDGGQSWYLQDEQNLNNYVNDIYVKSDEKAIGVGGTEIFMTSNLSSNIPTWYSTICLPYKINSISNYLDGYLAVGNKGVIALSTDGINWELENAPVNFALNSVRVLGNHIWAVGDSGTILSKSHPTSVNSEGDLDLKNFSLLQNYPNPFNPETTIQYIIPTTNMVTITVYDIMGKKVKELVNEYKTRGSYKVIFNAGSLSSGIYFYQIKSGNYAETKKLILMK